MIWRDLISLKEFITYNSQEKGICHAKQDHRGKHQIWSGGRSRSEGEARPKTIVFSMEQARQDRRNSLGLVTSNNINWLWARVVWYLALGDLKWRKYWLSMWELDIDHGWEYRPELVGGFIIWFPCSCEC